MTKLHKLLKERIVFLDGAFGTELQKKGLGQGDIPELWNITHPDIIKSIHTNYINAGSDIINTNTFGGNRIKLKELGLDDRIKEINESAVKLAREASHDKVLIAGSIGPTGVFLEPFGPLAFKEMYNIYKEQVQILVNAGVDIINFETMVDIGELRAAVLAAFDTTDIPVFANLTFDSNGRTLTGSDPLTAFNILHGLGVEFIGTNCGLGPKDMYNILSDIREHISAKLVIQANAGLPVIKAGKTSFSMEKEEYIGYIRQFFNLGISVLGGCCGTTPEFIESLVKEFKNQKPKDFIEKPLVKLSSPSQTILCGNEKPFMRIGEKINPSASKKLRLEVQKGNLSLAKELALRQEKAGAGVLDVNMGTSGVDETELLTKAVKDLTALVKVPLSIDSTRNEAIKEAVMIYPGRVLINSISGEKEKLKHILPIMKRYGSYSILLPINEKGIPETMEERREIIKFVLDEADKYGITKERFIVDCLVMTLSAAQPLLKVALDTVRMVKEEFGISTTAGLSNVSFGLPQRNIINASFLSMLISHGLDSAIVNVENSLINAIINSGDVITGRDKNASKFIETYKNIGELVLTDVNRVSDKEIINDVVKEKKTDSEIKDSLYHSILTGDKDNVLDLIKNHLNDKKEALEIVNNFMIPAIIEVGKKYDTQEYFLPQLMLSAETMKKGFNYLSPLLQQDSKSKAGKIVLATVKGDVHDIGKNIVSIMLSNHGFEVIDLGKDIESERIIEIAVKENASLIGLSALMTTTMEEMGRFTLLCKQRGVTIPVMVGGAVLNEDYARSIGAHYAKDAVRAVDKAKELLRK